MSWLRGSLILLGLFAAAALVAWLTVRPGAVRLPAGSSRSYQPEGTRALFLWAESTGRRTSRFDRPPSLNPLTPPPPPPPAAAGDTWLVVQPQRPITPAESERLNAVADRGGTVVLAGSGPALSVYLVAAEVRLRATPIQDHLVPAAGGEPLRVSARSRVERVEPNASATPLLYAPDGGMVAVRQPYRNGTLVIVSTADVFSNAGLADPATARFVFRELLSRVPSSGAVTFDESLYLVSTADPQSPEGTSEAVTLGDLVYGTAPGRAVLLAAGITFLYILLVGQRFGPPLPAAAPEHASRSMEEHVQALASLYRRARHFRTLRDHVVQQLHRADAPPSVLAQVEQAQSEAELLEAVAHAPAKALQSRR